MWVSPRVEPGLAREVQEIAKIDLNGQTAIYKDFVLLSDLGEYKKGTVLGWLSLDLCGEYTIIAQHGVEADEGTFVVSVKLD